MAKDHTDAPGPHIFWAGKNVRTDQIEHELIRLWHMSIDNLRTNQNIHIHTRTSVLNFVICAPDIQSAQQASTLIRDLSCMHIARVILLILDTSSDSPAHTSTWVTLRSFSIPSDMMRHHFEQITLKVTGSTVYSLAGLIQPLLKPDLPVYLWWLNSLPDDPAIFHPLTNMSHRAIIDSSRFIPPEKSIATLSSIIQRSSNCAFSDLNWGRLTPWRELIAQFFDMAEYRPYLAGVHQIEIEYAVTPFAYQTHTDISHNSLHSLRALFLAAWLKTRLGWKLSANENDQSYATDAYSWHMTYLRAINSFTTQPTRLSTSKTKSKPEKGASTKLFIRPRVQTDVRPGTICLVCLSSTIDSKHAIFTINREENSDHVLTSVELAENKRPQRIVHLPAIQRERELLHRELEITGRDYLYEETLHELLELLAQSK